MAVTETNTPFSLNSPLSLPSTSTIDNNFSLDNFSLMPTTLGGFNSILPELTTIPFSDDLFSEEVFFLTRRDYLTHWRWISVQNRLLSWVQSLILSM